jgi:hypothetical protein
MMKAKMMAGGGKMKKRLRFRWYANGYERRKESPFVRRRR